jgi:hypothetical protein
MAVAQERINRQGQQYIADLAATAYVLWRKACEEEGIPPDSIFVAFSDNNQYAKFYDIALRTYLAAKAEYAAGGYVGLRIVNGKAS